MVVRLLSVLLTENIFAGAPQPALPAAERLRGTGRPRSLRQPAQQTPARPPWPSLAPRYCTPLTPLLYCLYCTEVQGSRVWPSRRTPSPPPSPCPAGSTLSQTRRTPRPRRATAGTGSKIFLALEIQLLKNILTIYMTIEIQNCTEVWPLLLSPSTNSL